MMFRPLQLLFVSNLRCSSRGSNKFRCNRNLSYHHRRRQFTTASSAETSTSALGATSKICIFASEVPVIANLNRYRNIEDVSI